jgi:hypothetical protein
MSKPEHCDNEEEQGLPGTDGHETKDSGPSRRRFIRNIAIGTAGAAIAMSNLDRLRGASRLLERLTNAHVDGFMEHIKDATTGSPQAKQEFERISKLILDAVGNDQKSLDTYNAIKYYLAHPAVPPPGTITLGDIDLVMGAGYLRAMDGLQHTTRRVSADDIKKRLQNPKAILHIFESGFLNQLYLKTKEESTSNLAFAKRLAEASTEMRGVAFRLGKPAQTEARLVPAGFFQCASDECSVDLNNGNPPTCISWEWCVGLVVLLVVVFAVLK